MLEQPVSRGESPPSGRYENGVDTLFAPHHTEIKILICISVLILF